MNKQVKYTYSGMRQDTSNSKFSNEFYFEGMNIRILATNNQSSGSVTNTKGNEFLLQIPIPVINTTAKTITYNNIVLPYLTTEITNSINSNLDQIILGNCRTKNGFVIFSTNNNGLDCIWFLDQNTLTIKLLYLRNLNFNTLYPIQALNNYENSQIDKIYWVDGKEQLRFLNIYHGLENNDLEELIDVSVSLINVVSDVNFSEVIIDEISYGGTHVSGMIQYAYSYYKINGTESSISPLSIIIPLGKSINQGGDPNDIVGTIPKIVINSLDDRFTNLKLYAIKYTSLNQLPSVGVVADVSINGLNSFTYYDSGKVLYPVTIEQMVLNFSRIIVPKHIESKNSRLFAFNYKDKFYKLSQKDNNLDCRAYSFPLNSSSTTVYNRINGYDDILDTVIGTTDTVNYSANILNPNFLAFNNAAINGNYLVNKYQPNSNIIGGEGYFIKYEIIRTTEDKDDIYDYRFFKDNELYRIAIQFYNKFGIKSTPNWIADFINTPKDNQDNLSGYYAGMKLTLKPEFYTWLNDRSNFLDKNGVYDEFLKPVGFKLVRGDRTVNDKSILAQGLINGMMVCTRSTGYPDFNTDISRCHSTVKMPSLMRRFDEYLCPMFRNSTYDRLDKYNKGTHPQYNGGNSDASTEVYKPKKSEDWRTSSYQFNKLMQMYSPDMLFNITNDIPSSKLRVLGGIENNRNQLKYSFEKWQDASFEGFGYRDNCISTFDVKSNSSVFGVNSRGIYGPDFIHQDDERKKVTTYQYFRNYTGRFIKSDKLDNEYIIYGKPEITEADQPPTQYNGDSDLNYVNNLGPMASGVAGNDGNNKTDRVALDAVVSKGARCATFALGEDDELTINRKAIEDLFNESQISNYLSESGLPAPLVKIDLVVRDEAELLLTLFPNKYIGVLSTNDIYFNDNTIDSVGVFNSENVDIVFDTLAEYNTEAISTAENWTNYRIVILSINNYVRIVNDQMTSTAGLTVTTDSFDYLSPLPIGSINQYVNDINEMYSINTLLIYDGYVVGVLSSLNKYIFNSVGSSWTLSGTFILPPSQFNGGAGLITEFVRDKKLFYVGSYYGGNSYESKTKTIYVDASKYFNVLISINNFIINDPGDTFIQEYPFLKISKTDQLPSTSGLKRITEIVKVRLESVVNQYKRNDESRAEATEAWQPSQGDFQSYNTVYSQAPSLIKSQDISYEVKQNELYESSIVSSGFKRPGEIIDSWTSFDLLNTMNLEGKYGSINAVVKHKDEILTLQDNAIAKLSINPRVQIQGDDGISIKLGTGNLLDRYDYIDSNSGTLNKWGVISTNSGIFYYDTINNSLNIISQNNKLSDFKHLHSFFQRNIDNDIIKLDNHVLKNGIQFGYDYLNNDVYFTFLQGNNSKTINFNELQNEFVSLHGFKPSFYFNKGNIFLTTESSNTELYNHLEGIYNKYYGEESPSYIIYNLNPEPDVECVFDNIEFKSELYLNGVDIPDQTITDIQCYNEYQDSGSVPLVNRRNGNLRRKFRDWNAFIPREGRFRIRGPYSKLKLEFKNDNNKKLVLHDMIVSYTI